MKISKDDKTIQYETAELDIIELLTLKLQKKDSEIAFLKAKNAKLIKMIESDMHCAKPNETNAKLLNMTEADLCCTESNKINKINKWVGSNLTITGSPNIGSANMSFPSIGSTYIGSTNMSYPSIGSINMSDPSIGSTLAYLGEQCGVTLC